MTGALARTRTPAPVPVAPVPVGSAPAALLPAAPAPVPCTLLLGNPRPASRTARVGRAAVAALADRLAATGRPLAAPSTVDLAELAPVLLGPPTDRVAAAVATVRSSGLLVVASPTYKAAYTGLLKVFLDGLPRAALAGVVAVPLMTSASPAHRAAVELQLRPLLVELGATVPAPGLSVLEAHFGDLDAVLGPWAAGVSGALARALTP